MPTSYRLDPINNDQSTKQIKFYFNGKEFPGIDGEAIAAALMANGIRSIRVCEITGESRGIYCGIGHCYECRAEVDGIPNIRTCLTPIQPGMKVFSPRPLKVGS